MTEMAGRYWEGRWRDEHALTKTNEPAVRAWHIIEKLREVEGCSVEILCDNPDPGEGSPAAAIEVCGDWTGWTRRRFSGPSIFLALEAAWVSHGICRARGTVTPAGEAVPDDMAEVEAAVRKAWEECGDVPFPLYDHEAEQIARAAYIAALGLARKRLKGAKGGSPAP